MKHQVVRYLVEECNADLNVIDFTDKNALDLAIETKQWPIAKYLIDKGSQTQISNPFIASTIKRFFKNPSQKNFLRSAIQSRNIDKIRLLLQYQVDVTHRDHIDHRGKTPLHWAAARDYSKGPKEIIALLLHMGIQYDVADNERKAALDLLIENRPQFSGEAIRLLKLIDRLFNSRHLLKDLNTNFETLRHVGEVIRILGFYETSSNDIDRRFYTIWILNLRSLKKGNLLHVAVDTHDLAALEYLLDLRDKYLLKFDPNFCLIGYQALDINVEDEQGYTPLNLAAKYNHREMVILLLRSGATFKTMRHQLSSEYLQPIENVFEIVKQNGQLMFADDELQEASLYAKDDEGKTLLHWAIRKGNIETVKILLRRGVDIDALDNEGGTPLHEAAAQSQEEIIRLLLQYGARFNIKNKEGKTPLNLLSNVDDSLLKRVDELFSYIQFKKLPSNGSLKKVILEELLSFSSSENDLLAVVQVRDEQGYTLLHWAAKEHYATTVDQLLQWGAVYDIQAGPFDKTPENLCINNRKIRNSFQLIVEWVKDIEEWADGTLPIQFSIEEIRKDPKKVAILIKARNSYKETPLHVNKDCFRLKFLLEQGADLTAQDLEGNTPLHRAAERGDFAVVKLFLDKNANVNAKNKNNQTQIDLSVREAVTNLLRKYGGQKSTELDLIVENGEHEAEENPKC